MTIHEFTVTIAINDKTVTDVLSFDSDDIYDGALAPDIRALARRAEHDAGLRESVALAE